MRGGSFARGDDQHQRGHLKLGHQQQTAFHASPSVSTSPVRYVVRHRNVFVRALAIVFLGAIGLLSSSCAALNASGPGVPSIGDSLLARKQLEETLDTYWRESLPKRPAVALANGFLVNGFPELSYESSKSATRFSQGVVRDLDRVNADALTPSDYVTLLMVRWDAESAAEAALFYWTDFSELSPSAGGLRDALRLLQEHPLQTPQQIERYQYLVEALPFQLGRIRGSLTERRARGYVASRDLTLAGIAYFKELRALGSAGPWSASRDRLAALDSAHLAGFVAEQSDVVNARVLPALDSLSNWLQNDYLPTATSQLGLWQYPGGKEYYRHLLRRKSSLDILPEEAHQVGLAELQRIDALLASVRTKMGWKGTVEALHDSLRRIGPMPNDDDILEAAYAAQQRIAPLIATRVLSLTSKRDTLAAVDSAARNVGHPSANAPLTIRSATPFERVIWPDGGFIEPLQSGEPGALVVTPRWHRDATTTNVAVHVFRAGYPGRSLQRRVVLSDNSIPPVRRWSESRGYVEGWQAYAASLAGELGMYADPGSAYARLLDEGFNAALLIADTGVHYLGWTRAQALSVMQRYSLVAPQVLDSIFVERVIEDPGGAGVATLGAREFAAQRTWMQRELGRDFALREWHAAVLSAGAVPLPILATHLEQWLYDTRRARAAARSGARKSPAGMPSAKKP